jgi:MFS family permease
MAQVSAPDEGLGSDAVVVSANPARVWANSTFSAFQFPVYRIVWWGSFIGFLAFNMAATTQSVVAYDLTGSNRAVGMVMFGQGIAMLMFNPFGGAIADRFNKRFLIILTQTVIGGVILAIAILMATGMISIFWLAVGSFATGAMFAVLGPTRTSLLADVVSSERIGNAMALLQVGGNFGRICAPFLAGALLAWPLLGPTGTYFFIASMFIFVLFTMSHIPSSPPRGGRTTSVLEDVRLGLSYTRRNSRLLHSVISYYCMTALGYSFWVVMPGFVKDDLGVGTTGLGAMLGMTALGGLIGSVLVASLADSKRAPLYLKSASALVAVSLFAVGFAPSFLLVMMIMVLVGVGVSAFQTLNNSIALRQADPRYYGRVMGLMQIAWGLINLLSLPTGFIADAIGERAVLSGAGLILGVVVLGLALWDRRLSANERAAELTSPISRNGS